MKISAIATCLVVSNFVYQAMGDQNWSVAFERSWFQVCAVFITCFCLWLAALAEQKDRTNG